MFNFFFLLFILSSTISIFASNRSQNCGSAPVPYPFGFTPNCKIQLNCSVHNTISMGEFPVLNITSSSIFLNVSPSCSRELNSASQFFSKNFALKKSNGLFLRNCSSNSFANCSIATSLISNRLNILQCGNISDSLSCFSHVPRNGSIFTTKEEILNTGCRYLYSSVAYKVEEDLTATIFSEVELEWWMDGKCNCSENANCRHVITPVTGKTAYRCECKDGFIGDGFKSGHGCSKGSSGGISHGGAVVAVAVISLVAGVLLTSSIGCALCKRRRRKKKRKLTMGAMNPCNDPFQHEQRGESIDLPIFDFDTIIAATNNFSSDNKLGEGGFGPVYKGKIGDDQEIAVKRLSKTSSQGSEEFKNEVMVIAKLQHRNLVRLHGCCIQGEERMLIYEYLPNKSLDTFLFEEGKRSLLDWNTRYRIITGIARGLLYLHQDSRFRIIHRDLKAGNILLDKEMIPKISDFGLARIFSGDQTDLNTRKIVGTYGYMSPEYAMYGAFSVKSDVFSFGVLVLEIISGKKNRVYAEPPHINLLAHAWRLLKEGNDMQLVDDSMGDSFSSDEVLRCVKLGLLCVQEHPEDRPVMSSVVQMFSCDIKTIQEPKQPGFTGRIYPPEVDSPSNRDICSNKLSMTVIEPR